MLIQKISPIAFDIFNLKIHYYGLVYALGLIFVYFYGRFLIRNTTGNKSNNKRQKEFKLNLFDNIIVLSALGMIIFSRLGFVLFNIKYFIKEPLRLFFLWNGGLTFYGGLFGGFLLPFLYLKYKEKLSLKEMLYFADIIIIPVSYVLVFGRLANLINSERIGIVYNGFLAIKYKFIKQPRFPIQILEAFKNLFIFIILSTVFNIKINKSHKQEKTRFNKIKIKNGSIFALFLILYGLFRFFVEFFRDAPKYLLFKNGGQFLSLISFFVGIFLLIYLIKRKE